MDQLLAEGFETLAERALAASEHRRVAQRVGAGFRFAKLLDQVEKVRRVVSFKRDDKLLIVEAKGVGGVQFY